MRPSNPKPPPSAWPATPTVGQLPAANANPVSLSALYTVPNEAPAPTVTVSLPGSNVTPGAPGPSLNSWEFVKSSGAFLPPSPPGEKATARQDQARQSSTSDGAGNSGCGGNCEAALGKTTDARTVVPRFRYGYFRGPGHEA